jgi:ABC-type multidrug transport system ATPase subunit
VVIKYLKRLSEVEKKTVVFSIHNPNSEIFSLFDRLILLAEGSIIYQGKANISTKYIESSFNLPFP